MIRIFSFCLGLLLLSSNALSAASSLPYDECGTAMVINPNQGFPIYTPPIPNISGYNNTGDPTFVCARPQPPVNSVWYEFTPGLTATYAFSIGPETATSYELFPILGVFTSPNGCGGPYTSVGCILFGSGLFANLAAGTTYFIIVAADFALPGETYAVQLMVDLVPPPANDYCQDAEVIPASGPFPFRTQTHNLAAASTNTDPAITFGCTARIAHSIWFKFSPAVTSRYVISLCGELTDTTVTDTVLAIYTSANNCAGPLAEVECNDNDPFGMCPSTGAKQSALAAILTAGTDYYIAVWQYYSGADLLEQLIPGSSSVQLYISDDRPKIIYQDYQTNRDFTLRFVGIVGRTYEVEASPDYLAWDNLGEATRIPETDQFELTRYAEAPYQFYRVKTPSIE